MFFDRRLCGGGLDEEYGMMMEASEHKLYLGQHRDCFVHGTQPWLDKFSAHLYDEVS